MVAARARVVKFVALLTLTFLFLLLFRSCARPTYKGEGSLLKRPGYLVLFAMTAIFLWLREN